MALRNCLVHSDIGGNSPHERTRVGPSRPGTDEMDVLSREVCCRCDQSLGSSCEWRSRVEITGRDVVRRERDGA